MHKTVSSKIVFSEKLPEFFRPLFWSYDFSLIDPVGDKERIIVNTINYGDWKHWRWILSYYGAEGVRKIIEGIPVSEFRERALKLICLLMKIKKMKYETRGAKIKAERNI